jgi:hypothetical protein
MAAPTLRDTATKRASETVTIPFDFTLPAVSGTTIVGSASVVAKTGLTVVTPTPTPAGLVVAAQVSGGVTGKDYWVTCTVTMSNGDVHQLEVVVLVRDAN